MNYRIAHPGTESVIRTFTSLKRAKLWLASFRQASPSVANTCVIERFDGEDWNTTTK